ncbi:hypothetical protein ACN6LA_001115 [Streptomyces sp. SAS_269]|uniref:hypothetical protein n=1 Tax=Streptomyces sp. SAS_269 TaxID=3412749 RepID=UPI00403C6330
MTNEAHQPNETDESSERRTAEREPAPDTAATARRARFGTLPERVRPEDTVETRPAAPRDPARDAYDPDEWLVRYRDSFAVHRASARW